MTRPEALVSVPAKEKFGLSSGVTFDQVLVETAAASFWRKVLRSVMAMGVGGGVPAGRAVLVATAVAADGCVAGDWLDCEGEQAASASRNSRRSVSGARSGKGVAARWAVCRWLAALGSVLPGEALRVCVRCFRCLADLASRWSIFTHSSSRVCLSLLDLACDMAAWGRW